MSTVGSMKNEEFEHQEQRPHPAGLRGRDLMVRVSKVGGGTVGRAYDGHWSYRVSYVGSAGAPVMEGDDLKTGTPKTHAQVVEIVMDFLTDVAS